MVEWSITDGCNYRCSYCSIDDSIKSAGYNMKFFDLYLKNFLKHIPRGWNFNIVGGEPFSHPDFLNITSKLVKAGYTISVFTNFSAPISDLKKFLKITNKRLVFFNISLHLEHSDPDPFIKKILELKKSFPDFQNYNIYSVALPMKLNYLKQISEKFQQNGIPFFKLLLLRDKKNQFYKYSQDEQKIIRQINYKSGRTIRSASNLKKIINTKGKMCDCGYKYVFLHPDGKAFRCIPSVRSKNGYLGNILKNNFSLYSKPEVCKEKSCYCFGKYTIDQFQELYL